MWRTGKGHIVKLLSWACQFWVTAAVHNSVISWSSRLACKTDADCMNMLGSTYKVHTDFIINILGLTIATHMWQLFFKMKNLYLYPLILSFICPWKTPSVKSMWLKSSGNFSTTTSSRWSSMVKTWQDRLLLIPILTSKTSLVSKVEWFTNFFYYLPTILKTSLLRRLQAQTLPDAAPPVGKIHPFSKIAVTFEPLQRFWCPSRFRVSQKKFNIVSFMTGSTMFTHFGVTAP